jgi:uncharacterized protein (DUF1499 family)
VRRRTGILALAALALAAALVAVACRAPESGLVDGRLRGCPSSPNCVNSQSGEGEHAIAPLAFEGDPDAAWRSLRAFLAAEPRVRIVEADGRWLHATFRTRWLRFVDDVELLLEPEARVVHVRSASRLGWSDLGVNRERVESIRARWPAGRDAAAATPAAAAGR